MDLYLDFVGTVDIVYFVSFVSLFSNYLRLCDAWVFAAVVEIVNNGKGAEGSALDSIERIFSFGVD